MGAYEDIKFNILGIQNLKKNNYYDVTIKWCTSFKPSPEWIFIEWTWVVKHVVFTRIQIYISRSVGSII